MSSPSPNAAIVSAYRASKLSQRSLADRTGISQSTLSRILSGQRTAKLPEIILIAEATGHTVAELTNTSIANRLQCAARATNNSGMESMREKLLHFFELDAYLEDQAIPQPY